MQLPIVFTVPFRHLGRLWPRGGCGTIAVVILFFMLVGAFFG